MKVILLQDIRNLGKKSDIKEVPDGYARNFLIAKKIALAATSENLSKRNQEIQAEDQGLKRLRELAQKLAGETIEFKIRTGEKGEVFGSVNKEEIIKKLKSLNYKEIKDVEISKPIKNLGGQEVIASFGQGIKAAFKIQLQPL